MLNENKPTKTISIVIPTYNEEDNIYYAYETLNQLFKKELPHYSMSIIFADNFSSDNTRKLIREICKKDNRVGAIFNSTNVGYARSSYYAMTQADGDAVILLSADLHVRRHFKRSGDCTVATPFKMPSNNYMSRFHLIRFVFPILPYCFFLGFFAH